MTARIKKWGNSLALRIPKPLAIEVGLDEGSRIDITAEGDKLVITPVREPELTLSVLLAQITPENLHKEVDTGAVVGDEAW